MKSIWKSVGLFDKNIIGFKDENSPDAYVANNIEPVGGPRSELFYDLRSNPKPVESVKEFLQLEKEGKLIEFFTHVLYNVKMEAGRPNKLNKTRKEALAAGFGAQRFLRIIESVNDIGEISLFDDLEDCLGNIRVSTQSVITCDHIRGLVFLINDGILDLKGRGNNSRKYLFRKYMQNFKASFMSLGLKDPDGVLDCLLSATLRMFAPIFPNFCEEGFEIKSRFIEVYSKIE
jgi:alanyl-tRNA synthetase